MLKENHRVMFFKLFKQPLLFLDRHTRTQGNVMQKLFEALQCGSLPMILILLWCDLLTEGEGCETQQKRGQ